MIQKLPCRISQATTYLAQQHVCQGAIYMSTVNRHKWSVRMTKTISAQYNLRPPHLKRRIRMSGTKCIAPI